MITTLSSREFNQRASDAKRAANEGPVFITDRGKPAHVLLSMDDYRKLTGAQQKIADLLASPSAEELVEFDLPELRDVARAASFE
ncbi:MAG: type II toxin-antitoxin system Phd/YefM family antitoxin [Gallionellaceae bacterium]|jgi:prevent-host-death family protein